VHFFDVACDPLQAGKTLDALQAALNKLQTAVKSQQPDYVRQVQNNTSCECMPLLASNTMKTVQVKLMP
jgi:hypothetical protein